MVKNIYGVSDMNKIYAVQHNPCFGESFFILFNYFIKKDAYKYLIEFKNKLFIEERENYLFYGGTRGEKYLSDQLFKVVEMGII